MFRAWRPENRVPLAVVVAGVACHFAVRVWLRPMGLENGIAQLLLGVAPNYLAAVVMPMAYLIHTSGSTAAQTHVRFLVLCGFVFSWLVIEELQPVVSASRVFDPFDLVASCFGISTTLAIYFAIRHGFRQKSETSTSSIADGSNLCS